MGETKNSLADVLDQLIRIQKNNMELLQKFSEIVSSNKETVTISLLDEFGVVNQITVATVNSYLHRIENLEQSLKNLTDLGNSDVNIRLADGTLKKVIVSRLPISPNKLTALSSPTTFSIKNNWFFESLLNPLLFVTFDVGGLIDDRSQRIAVKRYILQLNTADKIAFFNTNLKGKNNLNYLDFLKTISEQSIDFFLDDDDNVRLPLNVLRFSGNFSVIDYVDENITEIVNGETIKNVRRKYRLDKIVYADNLTGNNVNLKISDQVIVNNKNDNTRYEITSVDSNTNQVILKRIEGNDTIQIGVDTLSIFSPVFSNKQVQVAVGFNEYNVIFIKPIDPFFEIAADEWSDGVAVYTNDLTISTAIGTATLSEFYKSEVLDFGEMLMELAHNKPVPIHLGETPDATILVQDNLKVVQVNTHKINSQDETDLQKKYDQKLALDSEIVELENAINQKKDEIISKKYNTQAERNKDIADRDSLITEKTAKTNLRDSIVLELASKAKTNQLSTEDAVYHVRGFFPIPEPKNSDVTDPQEIIGFRIQYRYLSKNKNAQQVQNFNLTENNGVNTNAAFSNWYEVPIVYRKKVFDDVTGTFKWQVENVADADSININQIDLLITPNESIEIRVKSISEAGYTQGTPLESDWSTSITIDFPDQLLQQSINSIGSSAISEESKVRFTEELRVLGIDKHLSEQVTKNDKLITHNADSIATGDLDTNGNVIDVSQALKTLQAKIDSLQQSINTAIGALSLSITDDSGNVTVIKNNSTVELFAGYYSDLIANLTIKKGAIVTKLYNLIIENTSATTLELISYLPGDLTTPLPDFNVNQVQLGYQPFDYNIRGYEKVPFVLRSTKTADLFTVNDLTPKDPNNSDFVSKKAFKNSAPFQSQQVFSQFILGRYKDVGLTVDLYKSYTNNFGVLPPQIASGGVPYIWSGNFTGTVGNYNAVGNGSDSDFAVHTLHPDLLPANVTSGTPQGQINKMFENLPVNLQSSWTGNVNSFLAHNYRLVDSSVLQYPFINHSEYFNLKEEDVDSAKQLEFNKREVTNFWDNTNSVFVDLTSGNIGDANNLKAQPRKIGFTVNDQYLIGKNTCGSYLFIAPDDYPVVQVDGTNFLARKKIEFGQNNSIKIPIIFQFRMTDFFGQGTTGNGRIGGTTTNLTNLKYRKKIGLDVWVRRDEIFSFDIAATAIYKADTTANSANFVVQNL